MRGPVSPACRARSGQRCAEREQQRGHHGGVLLGEQRERQRQQRGTSEERARARGSGVQRAHAEEEARDREQTHQRGREARHPDVDLEQTRVGGEDAAGDERRGGVAQQGERQPREERCGRGAEQQRNRVEGARRAPESGRERARGHHLERAVVGLREHRRGEALRALQRLAERREDLPGRAQDRAGHDLGLIHPDEVVAERAPVQRQEEQGGQQPHGDTGSHRPEHRRRHL